MILKYWTKGSKNPTLDSWITAAYASCKDFPSLSDKIKLSIINPRAFHVFPPSLEIELKIFLLYLILGLSFSGLPIAL